MAQRTVPIPGEILKTTVILGLTFDELLVLAAIPLVLVLPSVFLEFVPLWVSFATVVVGAVGVIIVVAKTPKGQSPVKWFPAYVRRWFSPGSYTIQPKDQTPRGMPEIKYLDVVHTAPLIKAESEMSAEEFDFEEFKASIKYADQLTEPGEENRFSFDTEGQEEANASLLSRLKP